MALSFNGSSQYGEASSGFISAVYPMTLAQWVKGAAQNDTRTYGEGRSSTGTPQFGWGSSYSAPFDKIGWYVRSDAGADLVDATSTAVAFDSTWHHTAVSIDASRNYTLYVDGVADVTGTISAGAVTVDRIGVGALLRTTAGQFFTGSIGDTATWTRVLAAREIAALAGGARPSSIPEGLNRFWTVSGTDSPDPNMTGVSAALTLTASPAQAAHNPGAPYLYVPQAWEKTVVVAPAAATPSRRALLGVGV